MSREVLEQKGPKMTMTAGKTVKLETHAGEIIIDDIEEYVCGFAFFYVRLNDGSTTSFDRDNILAAYRRLPAGEYRQIHMKKAKIYGNGVSQED